MGGRIYLTGGYDDSGLVAALEIFDPATVRVAQGPPLPTPRYFASSAVLDGKIYVAGGSVLRGTETPSSVVEVFDPATGR